jgi:phage shock protein E
MKLIDVRTPQEFATQHAEGAENIPLQYIANGVLPDYNKDEELTLYCRSGGRSEQAKQLLEQAGFTRVTNTGGLSDVLQN